MEHPQAINLQSGATWTPPKFRGDVPTYRPPDRQKWADTHDEEPTELRDVPAKFTSRAQAAIARDYGSIEFDAAIAAQTALDAVSLQVHQACGCASDEAVFYDPETRSFWAYPFRVAQIA